MRTWTALSLALAFSMTGCMTSVDDLGSVSDELTLVECDRDDACERGEVCLITEDRDRTVGYCSTGDRCTSSRACPSGSVCRGGDGLHCMVVERDEPAACPRGSVEGYVLCAPGFDNVVLSRDPHCETCEADTSIADRCRAAGISAERCRSLAGGGDEALSIADRCRAAGFTTEQCREMVGSDEDGLSTAERCRAAGIPLDRCRELVSGETETDRYARCEAADISPERCRALLADDDTRDEPTRDPARDDEPARR